MNCHYVARDQPRYVRNRHDGDYCPMVTWHAPLAWVDCEGCEVCTRNHCLVQWHGDRGDCATHAETVCPACVGKVREHLTAIAELSGLPLVAETLTKGVNSEAADLLGPAADPKQWRQRGDYGHLYDADSTAGWHTHPLAVLGWFDMITTAHLGHKRSRRITITSAADYIGRNLNYLAADLEFDFVDMAVALEDCRNHLERVLHDGEQIETGAPCMTCRVPLRLVRGEREDRWTCPRCRQESTEDQYWLAVKAEVIEHAEWLTDADMVTRTGVKASTVRSWGRDGGPVRRRRDSERTVYSVVDVEEMARVKGMIGA